MPMYTKPKDYQYSILIFFFDDGTNIGYFPDGLHEDNSEGNERKLHIKIRDKLDDCILRKAIKETPPKPYRLTRFTIKVVFEEQTTLSHTK